MTALTTGVSSHHTGQSCWALSTLWLEREQDTLRVCWQKWMYCGLQHAFLQKSFTWVVSGDSGGAAEHLPAQRRVLTTVFNEDPLQRLSPVQLVQDRGSCGTHQNHIIVCGQTFHQCSTKLMFKMASVGLFF